MRLPLKARDIPGRVAAGAYVLHTGLEKWNADDERAQALHSTATNAFPALKRVPPERFARMLAAGEIAVGSALLLPIVPGALAGLALTGFSGSLLTLYGRTPALRKPGSIWPSQAGVAVSKDVWMLGIGLDLIVGAITDRRQR